MMSVMLLLHAPKEDLMIEALTVVASLPVVAKEDLVVDVAKEDLVVDVAKETLAVVE